jgi:hypothetical protein
MTGMIIIQMLLKMVVFGQVKAVIERYCGADLGSTIPIAAVPRLVAPTLGTSTTTSSSILVFVFATCKQFLTQVA